MNSIREQALVGIFVLVAAALLIGTILAVSGTFSSGGTPYHTYFKSAGAWCRAQWCGTGAWKPARSIKCAWTRMTRPALRSTSA